MSRLADRIEVTIGGELVELRPTLRAALRLARDFDGFQNLLSAISEGSMTVLARIVRECFSRPTLPHDLFPADRPLALTITEYRVAAYSLVHGFLSRFDDGEDDDANEGRSETGESLTFVRYYEMLFGYATGVLNWAPETAWNATPIEISAALAAFRRSNTPRPEPKASRPHNELSIDEQAVKFAAQLMNRTAPADAE